MEDLLDNLTEAQRTTLKQFRLNLDDLLTAEHTDYQLVKYLRARNFDLKTSEKIFKENYYNRLTFNVDDLVEHYEKPEVARKYETAGILGFAKDGTLIRYTACGRLDFYGFIMSMSTHELCLYFSHMMEHDKDLLKKQNLKTGKNVQEITYIMDLDGFTLQQVMHKNVMEIGLDFVRLVQDCYPEIWSHVFIVNAPMVFDKAFNLFKPVLRAAALERIHIADRGSTKNLLLKYIDENVLPVFLGGKRVDSNGDPECREFITFAGRVPEKLYSRNNRIPLSPSDPDVQCFTIRPRSMYNISRAIYETNTKVRLQIRSENGSVYFSLLYKEFGPDLNLIELPEADEYLDETADNFKYKQISVELRIQAQSTQEDATIAVKWPGIYIMRFNNSNSWFTSRRLMVKIHTTPPE